MKRNGKALAFASNELKNSKEIVLEAAKNAPAVFERFASDSLKQDQELLIELCEESPYALKQRVSLLKNEQVLSLYARNPFLLHFLSEQQLSDPLLRTLFVRASPFCALFYKRLPMALTLKLLAKDGNMI